MAFYMIAGLIYTSQGIQQSQINLTTWLTLISTVCFIGFALLLWMLTIVIEYHGRSNIILIRDYTVCIHKT